MVALIVADIDRLVSLLVYYLLLIHLVAFIHHAVGRHHARPSDLGDSTSIAVPFMVLAMGHRS